MKIHIIQQDDWVTPGEYLEWALRNGHEVSYTRCWQMEEVPKEAEADLLIVLGGYQNPAMTRQECAYYDAAAEKALIRKYADAGKAVIGVCLGAQLLGEAMGGAYEHSPECEIGPVRARLTKEGREDLFFRDFPDAFDAGEWHNDMPGLTPDAVILAKSEGCPRQIVRYGEFLYGFQTHMEFTQKIMADGIRDAGPGWQPKGRFVQTREELLTYDYAEMNRLLSAFLDRMMEAYGQDASGQQPESR